MSAATGSSTEHVLIYVRLLGEGTSAFRPAPAEIFSSGLARLLEPVDYDPDDEDWEFKPGSVVRLERRRLEGVDVDVAASLAE